jgi:hypothetical protein
MLLAPATTREQATTPAHVFAQALRQASSAPGEQRLGYIDLTLNGEFPPSVEAMLADYLHQIGNVMLKVPTKFRHAPADYHSTEQSEMDGPPNLVSLRLLARQHESPILGTYTDNFLKAQAVSTWQAMIEQGRSCFLLILDGTGEQAAEPLRQFFTEIGQEIALL